MLFPEIFQKLATLMKHKIIFRWFLLRVEAVTIDYEWYIPESINCKTIYDRLNSSKFYSNTEEIWCDLRMVFLNCLHYNNNPSDAIRADVKSSYEFCVLEWDALMENLSKSNFPITSININIDSKEEGIIILTNNNNKYWRHQGLRILKEIEKVRILNNTKSSSLREARYGLDDTKQFRTEKEFSDFVRSKLRHKKIVLHEDKASMLMTVFDTLYKCWINPLAQTAEQERKLIEKQKQILMLQSQPISVIPMIKHVGHDLPQRQATKKCRN